jgi:hypothetical protein
MINKNSATTLKGTELGTSNSCRIYIAFVFSYLVFGFPIMSQIQCVRIFRID